MRRLSILLFLLLATPAPAQEWRRAPEYDVLLTSHDIEPKVIRLEADTPVRLRFVNNTHQRHAFFARSFFRTAHVRGGDAELVADGSLEVAPLSTRTIALVPRAGRYKARSTNLLHRLLGMTGTIVVE